MTDARSANQLGGGYNIVYWTTSECFMGGVQPPTAELGKFATSEEGWLGKFATSEEGWLGRIVRTPMEKRGLRLNEVSTKMYATQWGANASSFRACDRAR